LVNHRRAVSAVLTLCYQSVYLILKFINPILCSVKSRIKLVKIREFP
jgi:hypothetical protein